MAIGDIGHIQRDRSTGRATFISGDHGRPILKSSERTRASDVFLDQYGDLFGVRDHQSQLQLKKSATDALGRTCDTYRQMHDGVPVFSGILKVHYDEHGNVWVANGDVYPVSNKTGVIPKLTRDQAIEKAHAVTGSQRLSVEEMELVIVDPAWYGNRATGPRLAYYAVVHDFSMPLRDSMFIDASTGEIVDRWSRLESVRNRRIHSANQTTAVPGSLIRSEGLPPVPSQTDVNLAYDYARDTYDFLFRAFGLDSLDGEGLPLSLTVRSTYLTCPNAAWLGTQSVYCAGTVTDDVVGHELAHGLTDFSADLIYQNQSGQLNESYSDILGELVDLFNGDSAFPGLATEAAWPKDPFYLTSGDDFPNVMRDDNCNPSQSMRWFIGEDASAFGGPIRDMWDPSCTSHPTTANDAGSYTCDPDDNGGVHSGSGVPNHAFAMVTDGKSFNNFTISAIGPIKAFAVWFRALTTYLTPAADFEDAFLALNQSAADLIGTFPNDPRDGEPIDDAFTLFDATQVDLALRAVEMNTPGLCGETLAILDSTPPSECDPQIPVFADDFEGATEQWVVSNDSATPIDWMIRENLPFDRGGRAFFIEDPDLGDCFQDDETGLHHLTSPLVQLPAMVDRPFLRFSHYVATELLYDGGIVEIEVNGGGFEPIPVEAFAHNPYNRRLIFNDNTNPLRGFWAFTGAGGQWGTSLVDLSSLLFDGDSFRIRFTFGKDKCSGIDGWYVDDVRIYLCGCDGPVACVDSQFCNGEEQCEKGLCQPSVNPCNGLFCHEGNSACIDALFWEDFEQGNANGWTLRADGSTASAGDWIIGDPNGIVFLGEETQPDDAFFGTGCAFTGQNTTAGTDDVDDGVAYLESPAFDLSGVPHAKLTVARWFYQRFLGDDPNDFFTIEVSPNSGVFWFPVEFLGANDIANEWSVREFLLGEFTPFSSTMRLRFGASDGPNAPGSNEFVEAAIDDVYVTEVECTAAADCEEGNLCTTNVCQGGSCVVSTVDCAYIDWSDPPDGAIDARQPFDTAMPDTPRGWDEIVVALTDLPELIPISEDYDICELGGDGEPPTITGLQFINLMTYRLALSEPIEPLSSLRVTHLPSQTSTTVSFLPADVGENGFSSADDTYTLITALDSPNPMDRFDIDRSDRPAAHDLIRLIDLLNGAEGYPTYLGASLPPGPCN